MGVTASDFTEIERELVVELLQQHYSKRLLPELADSELKLDPTSDELTIWPTLYWSERGAHFVVSKVATNRYRRQFFYPDTDQYGIGHDEYTDLRRCVLTLLRAQTDHEGQSAGISNKATAADLTGRSGDEEYHGPLLL